MAKSLYTPSDKKRIVAAKSSADSKERYRTCWRRDYARLLHSAAFRRLQGKTQLFPSNQSDFFRNRLTHSLEVAQIAKSIAIRVNNTHPYFRKNNIDTDLVETAALAHDLGHPPFGHNGEEALNDCMREAGGFEGNAQTLRILAKLEKRETRYSDASIQEPLVDGQDCRAGLNLTYRTLASVLKYDNQIPQLLPESGSGSVPVVKGYYYSEAPLVAEIKKNVRAAIGMPFKTIECTIMDVADDIAYSTYDLEDSFKAGFLDPLSMWTAPKDVKESVTSTIQERLKKFYTDHPKEETKFSVNDVYWILFDLFSDVFSKTRGESIRSLMRKHPENMITAVIAHGVTAASNELVKTGYFRTRFTSDLVGQFVRSIRVRFNNEFPAQSKVFLEVEAFKKVEVLKNFAFHSIIMAPRLKIAEHRGKDIVKQIFDAIGTNDGWRLMPEDCQTLYSGLTDHASKRRVICDFIAGMTDRYAVQFYGQLFGTNPESIYSPL